MRLATSPRHLSAGEFFGRVEARASFGCADISFLGNAPEVELHEHAVDHFVLLLTGAYATDAYGADGVVEAGAALHNPAGTRHADAFSRPSGMLMTLTPSAAFATSARLPDRGARVLGSIASARLGEIACEARAPDALSAFTIEASLLELHARHTHSERTPPRWLARARARLDEACEEAASVAALARECGVHPVYFARAFRTHTGATPGAYQRRVRARRAAALLARTQTPIAEIALACGFADQAAFTKSFSRVARLAPAAFRHKWRV